MTHPLFSASFAGFEARPRHSVVEMCARLAQIAACFALALVCVFAFAMPAHAQQPENKAGAANAASGTSSTSSSAAPDKVYPPLPSLSMLPPTTDSDDDPPPRKTSSKKKGASVKVKNEMPTPRLVVSDASRSYLNSVEQDIDRAMQK